MSRRSTQKTNELALKRSNLVLPSTGYELDREEMCYVEGGYTDTTRYYGIEGFFFDFLGIELLAGVFAGITVVSQVKTMGLTKFVKSIFEKASANVVGKAAVAVFLIEAAYVIANLGAAIGLLVDRGSYTVNHFGVTIFGCKIKAGSYIGA